MKENGHLNEKNMILKIDAEGAEWNNKISFWENKIIIKIENYMI